MNPLVITSKVGADGVLHLDVPVGTANANREVKVSIQLASPPLTPEEWRAFIQQTAGTWQGEFERPDQGEYEQRDEFP